MDNTRALAARIGAIDLFGTAGDPPPVGTVLDQAMQQGALVLPLAYHDAYATPVRNALPRLLQLAANGRVHQSSVDALTGAMFQHAQRFAQTPALQRFLAVVSDLFDSFLNAEQRNALMLPMDEKLPPLATFQHDGGRGPFTVEVDAVQKFTGGTAGVVSLPATFADHPLLWAALSHETGGHDVIHADPGLLDELKGLVPSALNGMPVPAGISAEQIAVLWGYWMDEAAADIYGLMNVGPAFIPNTAALIAGFNQQAGAGLVLRCESGCDPQDPSRALDEHPADVLRMYLALGALDSLTGLSAPVRDGYAAQVEAMTAQLAAGPDVTFSGVVQSPAGPLTLDFAAPVALLGPIARKLGAAIAGEKLAALHGHSIQDIETWDDADEATAQAIAAALAAGRGIAGMGDDAQLMAGATLAVLAAPDSYDAVTAALNAGLDHSFDNDPVWGLPAADRMYMRYR